MSDKTEDPPDPKLREQQLNYLRKGLEGVCRGWIFEPKARSYFLVATDDFLTQPEKFLDSSIKQSEKSRESHSLHAKLFKIVESELAKVKLEGDFSREQLRARLNGDFAAFFGHYYSLSH